LLHKKVVHELLYLVQGIKIVECAVQILDNQANCTIEMIYGQIWCSEDLSVDYVLGIDN